LVQVVLLVGEAGKRVLAAADRVGEQPCCASRAGMIDSTPGLARVRLVAVETIALSDGDLRWVFPDLNGTGDVLELVRQADAEIRLLAEHLGVLPGWTGSGIEFHRMPSGQSSLFGCAEAGDVSFAVDLTAWDRYGSAWVGPPWEVAGEIAVRCDAPADCGMHPIEEAKRQVDSPLEAARALREVATWLRQRAVAEPLESWRQRDTRSGHD
jgi:hypothetical protein